MTTAPIPAHKVLAPSTCIMNPFSHVEMMKEALSHELHYDLIWEDFLKGMIFLIVKDYQLRPIAKIDVHSFRKADDDSFIVTAQRIVEQIESGEFFRII